MISLQCIKFQEAITDKKEITVLPKVRNIKFVFLIWFLTFLIRIYSLSWPVQSVLRCWPPPWQQKSVFIVSVQSASQLLWDQVNFKLWYDAHYVVNVTTWWELLREIICKRLLVYFKGLGTLNIKCYCLENHGQGKGNIHTSRV